jgi:hypothetical protein
MAHNAISWWYRASLISQRWTTQVERDILERSASAHSAP